MRAPTEASVHPPREGRDEQASEINRLIALGATRVSWDHPDDPDFVVLADSEGNRFCVVDASHG